MRLVHKQKKKEIKEDVADVLGGLVQKASRVSPKVLANRRAQVARLREQAQIAMEMAKQANNVALIEKLTDLIADIEAILDKSDKVDYSKLGNTEEDELNKLKKQHGESDSEDEDTADYDNEDSENDDLGEDEDSEDVPNEDEEHSLNDDSDNANSEENTDSSKVNSDDEYSADNTDNQPASQGEDQGPSDDKSNQKSSNQSNSSNNTNNSSDEKSDQPQDDQSDSSQDTEDDQKDAEDLENNSDEESDGESTKNGASNNESSNDQDSDTEDEESEDEDENEDDANSDKQSSSGKESSSPHIKPATGQKNPFSNSKQKSSGSSSTTNQESDVDAMVRIIKGLSGKAREGAEAALYKVLTDVLNYDEAEIKQILGESLRLKESVLNNTKGLQDLSDEEYDDLVDKAIQVISSVSKFKDSEDLASAEEIKAENEEAMREIEDEERDRSNNRRRQQKAQQAQKDRYNGKNFKGFQSFLFSLQRAIDDDVAEYKQQIDSWSALDRRFEDDNSILIKGKMDAIRDKPLPSLDVFVDQSGSWSDSDVLIGQKAIAGMLEYEKQKLLKINLYYFSNNLYTDPASARREGGTNAWTQILSCLKNEGTRNAVIITDADMNWQAANNTGLYLDGSVWYLWKNGENSQEMVKKLRGLQGTFQYSFNRSDIPSDGD